MTPEMEAAAWEGLATNGPAQQHAEGSDAVARWLTQHNAVAIDRRRLDDLERAAAGTPTPDARNDAGLLAFIVRDLMAAAGYRYQPDKPLTDQARMCGQLIENTRSELEHEIADRKEAFAQHAAETQRLTDLVTELRKQLAAQVQRAEWAEEKTRVLTDDPAIKGWHDISGAVPTPAEWNALVHQRDGLRKIVMDKDEQIEHAVTDTLHDAVAKIRAIAAQVGPEGRIDTDELADYIGCHCGPGAPQHEHGKGGYRLAEPTRRASAEAELIWPLPAVLGDIEETVHD